MAAGPVNVARAGGSASILPVISIAADHDLILASIQLHESAALETAIGPTLRVSTSSMPEGREQPGPASFVLAGEIDQSVSWAVPPVIALSRVGGTEHLLVSTLTDELRPEDPPAWSWIDGRRFLQSFDVGGRVRLDRSAVAGAYRGVLVATAQFN